MTNLKRIVGCSYIHVSQVNGYKVVFTMVSSFFFTTCCISSANPPADKRIAINIEAEASALVEVPTETYYFESDTKAEQTKLNLHIRSKSVGPSNGNTEISVHDKNGKFIGLQQNYNEISNASEPITTGTFISPPISIAKTLKDIDILAYFYNDFGLESTRAAQGKLGATIWYTWAWNHTNDNTFGAYDPKRHPLLGWYRGDDPVVLDWICYWLKEAGVTGVILMTNGVDTTSWSEMQSSSHWLFQLFNNVPNFNGLKYIISGPAGGSLANFEAHWTDMKNNVMSKNRNYYVSKINGKTYPTIYLHEVDTLRTGTFASNEKFEAWLKDMAAYFQNQGHAGICVLGRHDSYYSSNAGVEINAANLNANGVYMFNAEYASFGGAKNYSDYEGQFEKTYAIENYKRIPNVMTAGVSKLHRSGWTVSGSTPDLFGKVLNKAVKAAIANSTIPKIVTIYNVSEWGEAGASLQPNMQDGFGYLDAIRSIENINDNNYLLH